MSNIDFKTVVPACAAGDKAAQDALMAGFYAWTVSEAKRLLHDPEDAKNVAVDFWEWMYVRNGISDYDAARGAFYPWMQQRLRHFAMAAAEKKQVRLLYYSEVSDPTTWGDFDPSQQLSAVQDLEAVAAKLRTAQHKDVFWRLIEGATPEDIAGEIGVSVKRVRNLIGDVRAAITKQLEGD